MAHLGFYVYLLALLCVIWAVCRTEEGQEHEAFLQTSTIRIDHTHRLSVRAPTDSTSIPSAMKVALGQLRDAHVMLLYEAGPALARTDTLNLTDILTITLAGPEGEGLRADSVSTVVLGADPVLILVAPLRRPDQSYSLGVGSTSIVCSDDTPALPAILRKLGSVCGWPAGTVDVREVDRTGSSLVSSLLAGQALESDVVALWLPLDHATVRRLTQADKSNPIALVAYDTGEFGMMSERSSGLLQRVLPFARTRDVDVQSILGVGNDVSGRILTLLTAPAVLAVDSPDVFANPLVPLVEATVRQASGDPRTVDGENARLAMLLGTQVHALIPAVTPQDHPLHIGAPSTPILQQSDGGFESFVQSVDMAPANRVAIKSVELRPREAVPGFQQTYDATSQRSVFVTAGAFIGGVRLRPGDRVVLEHQERASENGKYVVTATATNDRGATMVTTILWSYDGVNMRATGPTTFVAQARMVDPHSLRVGDRIYLTNVSRLVQVTAIAGTRVEMADMPAGDSAEAQAGLVRPFYCTTDPTIMVPALCSSKYTGDGQPKASGRADVWDAPCAADSDCPFYQANRRYPNVRGGCVDGTCELPLGLKRTSYRTFDAQGQPPICYGCEGGFRDGGCCDTQRGADNGADYAFEDDQGARAAAGLTSVL